LLDQLAKKWLCGRVVLLLDGRFRLCKFGRLSWIILNRNLDVVH
jgi:hypothetical protein